MPYLATVGPNTALASDLAVAAERVNDYIEKSKAANTLRGYASDWRCFVEWCAAHGLTALPAEAGTLSLYLSAHALRFKVATLERHVNAINFVHRRAGHPAPTESPAVREFMRGLRRERGVRREGKAALSVDDLRAMVDVLPDTVAGRRDRALILLGFAGAMRRSELAALECRDLSFVPDGLVALVRRSKTDQEGEGQEVGISYGRRPKTCPVAAVRDWLEASSLTDGPVFRPINRHGQVSPKPLSGDAIARIVQRLAVQAGIASAGSNMPYGAHSLRAGHATTAAGAGVEERVIMRQGRWKSERTVRSYIRHGSLFTENSSGHLGL